MARDDEYYPTARWLIERYLEDPLAPVPGHEVEVIEPCVGDGALVRGFVETRRGQPTAWSDCPWHVGDIRTPDERNADYGIAKVLCEWVGDFAAHVADKAAEIRRAGRQPWLVTNPPFSLALSLAQVAVPLCDVVVMHVRLAWQASQERNAWLREHVPTCHVLPDRCSYDGSGNGHMHDSCWLTWGATDVPRNAILAATPKHVRVADQELARRLVAGMDVIAPPLQVDLFARPESEWPG